MELPSDPCAARDQLPALFHQLDLRVDKRWVLNRTSVTAYLDVQKVYNRLYPEVWLYTSDWAERRRSLLGLPIYPSLGVQVDS